MGPHQEAHRGRSGEPVRHRGSPPRRYPLPGCVGGEQLCPASRPGRSARDSRAYARCLRGVGQAVRAEVQTRSGFHDDRRAVEVSVRNRRGGDPADQVPDRTDRKWHMHPSRTQSWPDLTRQGALPACSPRRPFRPAVAVARAKARHRPGRAEPDCRERSDRRGQGALFPHHLAYRRLRHGQLRPVQPLSRALRGCGLMRGLLPGRFSPQD